MLSTKSRILTLLEKNRGKVLSGPFMAKSLKVSRSAVWKSVEELRSDGYVINAVTNRGYSLSKDCDILSAEGLLSQLKTSHITYDKIHIYKCVGSTNLEAKKMAVAGAMQGTVVMAEEQTEGRGRMGRNFYSPKGTGLYMSVILRPQGTEFEAILATPAAAVAVCRVLADTLSIQGSVKWVNDIFVNGLKVCGVLTEAISDLQTKTIESLIIGIGINVSTDHKSFPENINTIAGSLLNTSANTPGVITRNRLAANVLDELFNLILFTKPTDMINEYKRYSFLPGKPITVYQGEKIYDAEALDIDGMGGLIIKKADGSVDTLRSGEVSVRPRSKHAAK